MTPAQIVEQVLVDHLAEALEWNWDASDEENIPAVEDVIAGVISDLMVHVRAALPNWTAEVIEVTGQPTTCKVWRDGVLVFDGADRSHWISQ